VIGLASTAEKTWVRLRVGVGKAKAAQWIRIVVHGKAVEAAAILKGGTRSASKVAYRSIMEE